MDNWHGEYLPVDYDPMPNQSDLASEDCLTLDVKVPSRAYSSRAEHQRECRYPSLSNYWLNSCRCRASLVSWRWLYLGIQDRFG